MRITIETTDGALPRSDGPLRFSADAGARIGAAGDQGGHAGTADGQAFDSTAFADGGSGPLTASANGSDGDDPAIDAGAPSPELLEQIGAAEAGQPLPSMGGGLADLLDGGLGPQAV